MRARSSSPRWGRFCSGRAFCEKVDAFDPLLHGVVPFGELEIALGDLLGEADGSLGRRFGVAVLGLDGEVAEDFCAADDDAVLGGIEDVFALFLELIGEHFAEPGFLELRGEREEDLCIAAAAFDLGDFRSDDEAAVLRDACAGEHAATAVNDVADERASAAAAGNLVSEAGEDRAGDGVGRSLSGLGFQAFVPGDIEELLEKFLYLPRGVGMHGEGAAGVGAKIILLGPGEGAHEDEEVRGAVAEGFVALLLDALVGLEKDVARLGECGDERGGAHAAEFLGFQEHAGVARVDGEIQHAAARRGDLSRSGIESAEVGEEKLRTGEGFFPPACRSSGISRDRPRRRPSG